MVNCAVAEPDTVAAAGRAMAAAATIARGNGRSYGDSSLNPDGVVATRRLSHMLAFDDETGMLVCEGGVLLADIIEAMLPRGWFAPVTPGTRFVTVGGMIASDVHGKNHHGAGSFGDHVAWLDLALPDGRVLRCSATEEPELFAATVGGMGLTGVIVRAAFGLLRVRTARIRQRTVRTPTLEAAFATFEAAHATTYSVAWIDGLASGGDIGRSVVFLGEHAGIRDLKGAARGTPFARSAKPPRRVPLDFPGFALSRTPVRLFNHVYYRAQAAGDAVVDIYPYFYPLDALLEWNRIYGRRGFVQYQCVLPLAESMAGMRRLLAEIARAGSASFLAVLKRMGPQSFGLLSFPMEGYTLAMDFPATPDNLALLDRLDAITVEHGGRIYLAKDARVAPAVMAAGYPRLDEFRDVRRRYGLSGRIESLQSRRLEI
ncbi:MAG: FAD-binding oxidoreductase [Janthinobacterium lividum]